MTQDPYKIVVVDGKTMDALTMGAIGRAEKILGRKIPIVQGGLNAGGVAASAGTHDGLGVFDTKAWDHDETVIALRAVGFAAWYRPTIPGLWSEHIHAVLIGHGKLAPAAARQVQAYLQRRDGLKSNAIDTDPGWTNIARYTVESFRADVLREERQAKLETAKARGAKWKRWLDRNRAFRARLRKALRS